MFRFRNLILAATAATIAVGGATAVSTTPADAGWFKDKRQERQMNRHERRGVMGWFGMRDRGERHGWNNDRRERKHWNKKRHHRYSEPAPRQYRPMK
jgi:hypothetical protein